MSETGNSGDAGARSTRGRILAFAAGLFARHGYHGVGMRDIARGAGVNVATISYHFQSKVGVLKEIVREVLDTYKQVIRSAHDVPVPPGERILGYVRAVIHLFREHGELALVAST